MPSRSDRKSTRLNSSHLVISYAVFCLKKKNRLLVITVTYSNSGVSPLLVLQALPSIFLTSSSLCCQRDWNNPAKAGFFFTDTATPDIYTLSLHDALPI